MKSLGIPGVPPSIDILLNGSIYAAIINSVPARLSIIVQALQSNLSAGSTCVLVTHMTPGVFLSMADMSGIDFREDISQNRLYLFSRESEYAAKIFRHGVGRFLQEFDFFKVPKKSFFLFDQAGDFFTLSDENIAQTQVMDYRDWMRSSENTSLFLFIDKAGKEFQPILNCFNGVVQINQNKSGIKLLIDFWYSQDGATAAKTFPVSLDTNGLIRVDPSLPQTSRADYPANNKIDDHNTIFYFGPDFESFSTSIYHPMVWIQAQSFVDLIHLSRNAFLATVVISLGSHSDLENTAKIVHYLRSNRGSGLKIVIRESGFSLRYLNELALLRFGANLIIHQQVTKQQLLLLWEMLAGQTYTRKIKQNFDLTQSSMLSSSHKGYVDLVTFCSESLCMLERGSILGIPSTLIVASYHENTSPPDILSQVMVVRDGDVFSSDATHCYIFVNACVEENSVAALSHITNDKQASLFRIIRYILTKENIQETLQYIMQTRNIAPTPDFREAIAQSQRANKLIEARKAIKVAPLSLETTNSINKKMLDVDEQDVALIEDNQLSSSVAVAGSLSRTHYRNLSKKPVNLQSW